MLNPADVLNELNIPYKLSGDHYIIPCPNPGHDDKHPSCSMRASDGVFKCFACGFKGNLYTLYNLKTGKNIYKEYREEYSNSGYSNVAYEKKPVIKKGDLELTEGKELSVFSNPKVMEFLKSIGVYSEDFIFDFEVKYTKFARYKSKNVEHEKKWYGICKTEYSGPFTI